MVGYLQDIGLEAASEGCQAFLYRLLDISGQQEGSAPEGHSQNQGVVVEISVGGAATRIEKFHSGPMNIEPVPGLKGSDPEAACFRLFEQCEQTGGNGAVSKPEFLDLEVVQNKPQTSHMVLVGMGQDHRFQRSDAAAPEIRRDHLLTDVKSGPHDLGSVAGPGPTATAIDQSVPAVRPAYQDAVSLPHIQKSQTHLLRSGFDPLSA